MNISDIKKQASTLYDIRHSDDTELLAYLNDLNRVFANIITPFPAVSVKEVDATKGELVYPLWDKSNRAEILSVYADSTKLLDIGTGNNSEMLTGYWIEGNSEEYSLHLTDDIDCEKITLHYRYNDNNAGEIKAFTEEEQHKLVLPVRYWTLYVYYILMQIASKENSEFSYNSFKQDYQRIFNQFADELNKKRLYAGVRANE